MIDWTGIANQAVFGAICFVAGWVVTSIAKLKKDIGAAFGKIRALEERINKTGG